MPFRRGRNSVPAASLELPLCIDAFHRLTRDILWVPQPNVDPTPVVKINYTQDFSLVMGIYLGLMKQLSAVFTAAAAAAQSKQDGVPKLFSSSADCRVVPTSRWLMLLGFVLSKCPSHYTAWRQRRDVVMDPQSLLDRCAAETFCETLPVEVQEMGAPPVVDCEHIQVSLSSGMSDDERELVTFWLPSAADVVVRKRQRDGDDAGGGTASFWRCVLWELRLIRNCFVRDCHKNFQLWHHRKELLEWAVAQTPAAALVSVDAFSAYLQDHHDSDMEFGDVDERDVCESILCEADSKNYHVWSHRAWFLTLFPFLTRSPWGGDDDVVRSGASQPAATYREDLDAAAFNPLPLDSLKDMSGCELVIPPSTSASLLTEEIRFTTRMISEDWFNNSAWCHRYSTLQRFLVVPLMQSQAVDARLDETCKNLVKQIVESEVHFALQWAAFEPCNECPFVFAKGIADLWQTTCIRSSDLTTTHAGAQSEEAEGAGSRKSWAEYDASRSLHRYIDNVIQQHVIPVADALREHLGSNTEGGGKKTATSCGPELGLTRSRFLLANTHQPLAAQFRLVYDALEALWNMYASDEERRFVESRFPADRVLPGGSQPQHIPAQDSVEGAEPLWLQQLLQWEAAAISIGKELYARDPVRAKYWKHEVHIVLHRQY